jgi:hypothetical protein
MMPTNVSEASDNICNNCDTIQAHASSPFILALIQIKLIKYPLFSFIEMLSFIMVFKLDLSQKTFLSFDNCNSWSGDLHKKL